MVNFIRIWNLDSIIQSKFRDKALEKKLDNMELK
jgi:hypothetical protein